MHPCPACGKQPMNVFYTVENIPVHSVRLLWSREEALRFPTGRMELAHCPACGFIGNVAFEPALQDYAAEYESTQAYSPTFNAFARRLAEQLVDRYDLRGKEIIEIGCGQGEFLSLLCEIGGNRGAGFDPAYDPARSAITDPARVTVIPDYYSEQYTHHNADFVCCKMTLEHIPNVAEFVATVRRAVGDRPDTVVFFQVPDVDRVLKEAAFWDIYYEHCSYFSLGSIARLFRQEGFEVLDLWRDYGDQYLMIEARPASAPTLPSLPQENDLEAIAREVERFPQRVAAQLDFWRATLDRAPRGGQKVILWGSGSKGVAFLTTLGIFDAIEYTVDINPNKHGTFMAATGQAVVAPSAMQEYRPDLVILMNPLYYQEVQETLAQMGLHPRMLSVGEETGHGSPS